MKKMCAFLAVAIGMFLSADAGEADRGLFLAEDRVGVRYGYWYWEEEGRGILAQISRTRHDVEAQAPLFSGTWLTVQGHNWTEKPFFDRQSYHANGYSLFFHSIAFECIRMDAQITEKNYSVFEFPDTRTGYVSLLLDVSRLGSFGGKFERRNEIYNYFGLLQRLQADVYAVSFESDNSRRFQVCGTAEYLEYSDYNKGMVVVVSAGYALTDGPGLLRFLFGGEYRDTAKHNMYLYFGEYLSGIIHPYWAPQDYWGEYAGLAWHQDLASVDVRGNTQHGYDLELKFGTDTDSNLSVRLEGVWRRKVGVHFEAAVRGFIYRSHDWDAQSASAALAYKF